MRPDARRENAVSSLSSPGEPKARPGNPVTINVLRRLLGGPVNPWIKVQDQHSRVKHLRRFGAHEGGAAAVIAAIMFPVVIGGMGLGAETGYWYLSQRMLQHAADVTAHAAGSRLRAGDTKDKIDAAALHVATQSGYSPGTLAVNMPPASGDFTGDADSVEVIVTHTQARLFSAVFNDEPVTIAGRAVAKVTETGSVACVLALSPTKPGAVTISGSSAINLEGCDVASNSNASDSLHVASDLTTGCAYAVGEAYTPTAPTLTVCDEVKEFAPKVRDPYAEVAEPASWSGCDSKNQGHPTNPSDPLTPRCFSGGLVVKGELHFEPGLYIVDGGKFTVNSGDNARLTGEGVTFYLANGAELDIGSKIQMNFSAPGPGDPYAGILFFGDRTATDSTHKLTGNPDSDYTGAIYTPASDITFAGKAKTTGDGCIQIIGNTVTITGNSNLKSTCDDYGTEDIATNETVKIVE